MFGFATSGLNEFIQVLASSVSNHAVKHIELVSNLKQASPRTTAGQHNPSGKQCGQVARTFQISTLLDPVISPLRIYLKEIFPILLHIKDLHDFIYNGNNWKQVESLC